MWLCDFRCKECETIFERLLSDKEAKNVQCPRCLSRSVTKLFHVNEGKSACRLFQSPRKFG